MKAQGDYIKVFFLSLFKNNFIPKISGSNYLHHGQGELQKLQELL